MDPFTKQGNCPRTLIRKSPYTKAGHVLGSECPDLISRGNLFGAIPARSHSLFNKAVFLMCHWTTEDLFRITMQCFNPRTQWNRFSNSACLFTQQYNAPTCPWTAGYFSEQKMHPSTRHNSGLKLSMNI
ncbi:hypothetical protein TNCT_544181 [Trichonephila clavata]|uniref:Uncharacterized protein n=1 Tax=Trichonephila clavata TaxID=2740835 RepID=A0A8X6FSL2_TRICU|nr:hypothetical protein TNCT_544181 [Trichonephila clavata]